MNVKIFWKIILLLLLPINGWAHERLVFAIDIIRHGDRTPIFTIPACPSYNWLQGRGQLTSKGIQQEYQLGQTFRKRYIDHYRLLPLQYDSKTIYIRSSDYNRTIKSAIAVLKGLYPDTLSIPIHHVSQQEDNLLVPRHDKKKFKLLLEKHVFSSAEWKEKNLQYQNYYPKWSQATGIPIKDLYQLASIGSTLQITRLHQAPLPPALNAEDLNKIIQIGRWAIAARFKPKAVGKVTGGPLLTFIKSHLEKATQHRTPLKYVLLSAHDTTILSTMSAMGTPLNEPPDYATDLNFALFQKENGEYFLRITYNSKPVILPVCGAPICTLKQFFSLAN